MAANNLTVISRPDFPQVFTKSLDQLVDRILAKPKLGSCCHETNGEPCSKAAIVHALESDQEFCAKHFGMVSR